MNDLDALLKARGISQNLGAYVIAAVFNRAATHAAFGLGDGSLHITDSSAWQAVAAHKGAVLCLTQDTGADGFASGGDDGRFLRIGAAGELTEIATYGRKWVEHAASFADAKTGFLACAVGRNLHIFNGDGTLRRSLEHGSTVSGIAIDPKGKRIAASHYNGASLWFANADSGPKVLEWKGSHIGVAIQPQGQALVTAMQENALHGWTLPEAKHMRMSGYPAKTESFGFTQSGRWLATGGADAMVLWPFFGGGPMGKAPVEMGAGAPGAILKRIACHPAHEIVAAGFEDGAVIIADITKEKILPVCGPGRGAITALAWNPTGSHLAIGTEAGFAAIVDFSTGS